MKICLDCSTEIVRRNPNGPWPLRCPEHRRLQDNHVAAEYRARHPDRVSASFVRWRLKDPERAARTQRKTKLKANFGLTPEQFHQMIADQGGLCAGCCKRPATDTDHDHLTDAVRGILCRTCNLSIGQLGDDGEGIHRSLCYLAPHGGVLLEGL